MARERTLTSANSSMFLSVAGVFPVPVKIEGYATDNMFDMDSAKLTETLMGVDGKLSGGYTPSPRKINIHLQADSDSHDFFAVLAATMRSQRETFRINGIISVPASGKRYVLARGFLTDYKDIADHKKIQGPVDYAVEFESITPAAI